MGRIPPPALAVRAGGSRSPGQGALPALALPLKVVRQSDYETVLAALRDYIRISDPARRETWGVDDVLRLSAIRVLARTALPADARTARPLPLQASTPLQPPTRARRPGKGRGKA